MPPAKRAQIKLATEKNADVVGIRSSAENLFTAIWQKNSDAQEYTVNITPSQTTQAAAAHIQIAAMSHNKLYTYTIEVKIE